VLSDDPLAASDARLRKIASNLTLVGGQVVHAGGPFAGLA
jgi:hypothetical protein